MINVVPATLGLWGVPRLVTRERDRSMPVDQSPGIRAGGGGVASQDAARNRNSGTRESDGLV